MERDSSFKISVKSFAFQLDSLVEESQRPRGELYTYSGWVSAVWFRRKAGVTRASLGTVMLWAHYLPAPLDSSDPVAVLSAQLDGRYGGTCHARWDGKGYWGAEDPFQVALHMSVLEPMLAAYPAIPQGYDGWWRF